MYLYTIYIYNFVFFSFFVALNLQFVVVLSETITVICFLVRSVILVDLVFF